MKVRSLIILVVSLLISCSALAQKVSVDWDHSVTDFSKYKTYSWLKPTRTTPDPLMDERIVADIDQQLAAKGLQKVEQNPDLLVSYGVGLRQERSAMINGMGGWRFGGGLAEVNPEVENMGTLIVQISAVPAKQLIWRGSIDGAVSNDNPDKASQKLQKSIAKLFKDYPPQSKKK